ncbi:CEP350 [Bugula neritina]|uniref:CEP350 n=1 Tax=Bugula neritina TaxID=10212 RepID=A0A7J7JJU6_BUGNE|nr:CEP350 [Bugula neritina]
MSRTKRRDKLDAILTQELREEELSWLDYSRDELAVKHSLTESVFQVLLDDSVSAILGAYNSKHHIQNKIAFFSLLGTIRVFPVTWKLYTSERTRGQHLRSRQRFS